MNNMYSITSAFMMLIICILLRKLFFSPGKSGEANVSAVCRFSRCICPS